MTARDQRRRCGARTVEGGSCGRDHRGGRRAPGERLPDRPRGHPPGTGAGRPRSCSPRRSSPADDVPPPYVLGRGRRAARAGDGARARVRRPRSRTSSPRRPPASPSPAPGSTPRSPTRSRTSPGRARQAVDVYNDLLEDCEQAVVDDAGLRFTTEPLDFGVLSDDTLPLRRRRRARRRHDRGAEPHRHARRRPRSARSASTARAPPTSTVLDAVTRVAIGNLGLLDAGPPEPPLSAVRRGRAPRAAARSSR